MTMEEIYETYTIGSKGFIQAVSDYCGYQMSDEEIARIAARAATPDEFHSIWENEDFWVDKNN